MTTEEFVGRRAELHEIAIAIDRAMSGRGGMLLIAGEPGIGKTGLCEAAVRYASEHDVATAWANCWEGPTVPFWPWTELVRGAPSVSGPGPPDAVRKLSGERGMQGADTYGEGDSELVRIALFDAVTAYFRDVSEEVPLLLVVDDLHWADVPSLRLLDFFATKLRDARIAFMGTYRDVEVMDTADVRPIFERLSGKAQLLAVDGLHPDDVRLLIEATTGSSPTRALAASVYEQTGGNPLFVRELTRLLVAQERIDESSATPPVPEGVRSVIGRRLARLPQSSHELLQTAAVFGQEFRADLLARTVDADLSSLLELLDHAENGRLIARAAQAGRYAFSHALVREVLYESIPSSKRASIHARVGHVIEATAPDADPYVAELAHHFVHALPAGDVSKAIEYCARAARVCLARLAYEEAVVHFRRALDAAELVPDEGARSALLLDLGDAALRAGDLPQARDVFAEAAAIARRLEKPDELALAALGFGAGLSGFEVQLADVMQLDLLEEALATMPKEDSSLRAWVLARLSVARSLQAPVAERRAEAEEAVAISRRIGDDGALAYALSALCDTSAGPADAEARSRMATEIVRIAHQRGDRPTELLGRRLLIVAHLEAGDVAAVDAEIRAFALVADALRQPLYSWYVPLWRGMRAQLSGDLAAADRWADEAERTGGRAHSKNARMLAAVLRFMTALHRNDPVEVRSVSTGLIELVGGIGDDYNDLFRALCDALSGDVERVRPFVRRFVNTFETIDVDSEWLPTCCQFAETIVASKDRVAAEALYKSMLPHRHRFAVEGIAASTHGSVELHLGLLARVLRRDDDAIAHFEAAAAANTRLGAPVLAARARLELASVLAAIGRHDRAAELAADAARTFDQLGITGWDERVRECVPTTGATIDAPAPAAGIFRRDGELWSIAFGGVAVRLRDSKGLRDLGVLLGRPAVEVASLDLASERRGDRSPPSDGGLSRPGDAGEVLDPKARAAYKERLRELEDDIAAADDLGDVGTAERARAERDAIAQQLASAYGLGGRPRRAGDPAERARTTVTRRIREAIARIADVHPTLGRHLQNSVRTGAFCSYAPEQPVDWRL